MTTVTIIRNIVNGAVTTFSTFQSTVTRIFNTVRDAITKPIEKARDTIEKAIGKIKGFFTGLDFSLPAFKMPKLPRITFKNWSINPVNWIKNKPTVGVEWYDKGGIFSGPTVIGVGEKRPEFVGALDDLRAIVREEAGGGGHVTVETAVYLDKAQMARAIAPDIDLELARRQQRDARKRGGRI